MARLSLPKIEYKKKRFTNQRRRFRIWDSSALNLAMIQASEIKANLETICTTNNINLTEMKPTLIPSAMLYHLVESYLVLYKSTLNEDLIKTGNPKTNPTTH
jgi:hypothetical protein